MEQVLIVGLTGGIGAGKSTAARRFAELGASVIDVDVVGHQVLEPGGGAHDGVIAEFGPSIVGPGGRIDRASLGRIVFGDPDALARLTAISHPAINAELARRLDALPDDAVAVLDLAVLVESQLGRGDPEHSYSVVVTVEAPVEQRIARAVVRGMAEGDVRRRVTAQATEEQRRAVADHVLVNDGDEAALVAQVDRCWAELRARATTG